MTLSSSLPGCAIERVIRSDGRLIIIAHAQRVCGRCPTCGTTSSAVHSRYERRPADLPSIGQPMTLHLRVRRFYCHHPACRRRTFAESFPQLMLPRARRTLRLAQAQTRIGLAAGGEAGARLTGHLGMQTSPDTILRLVRRLPLPSHRVGADQADVAVESLRPEVNPDDTGSLRDDLTAYLQKFAEAMSSGPGRAAMRVMLGSSNSESMAAHCCEDTRADLVALVGRAERRDEPAPDADRLLDLIVARVMRTIAASCPSIFREKVTG